MGLKIIAATVQFHDGTDRMVSCRFTPPLGQFDGVLLGHESVTFTLTPCETTLVPPSRTPFGLDVDYMDARGNYWHAFGQGWFGWPFEH